jgi:hypothetical protein
MNASMLTASHYGVVHFGDLDCEAVVLTTGERGYVRKELAKLLGFHESHKGGRFARFLADIAPNSLSLLEKSSGPILLPSGRQTQFFPAGIIADVATSVEDAAAARAAVRKNIDDFRSSRGRKPTNAQAAFAARAEAERRAFEVGTIHFAQNGRISFGKSTRYFGWQTQRDYPHLFTSCEVKVRITKYDPLSSGVEVEPA